MKIYNPSLEERAFLIQEAQALEPLVKNLGSLSVLIEQVQPSKKEDPFFRVTFLVAPESVGMRVQASDSNLFAATISAKDETLRQLNALVNALPSEIQGEPSQGLSIPRELLH